MKLPSSRVRISCLAVVAAAGLLAGCSSNDDGSGSDSAAASSSGSAAPTSASGIGSNTELAQKLLTADDVKDLQPAGTTENLAEDTITSYVKGREQIKNQKTIFGEPCDSMLHTDTVVDGLLGDSVINKVSSGGSGFTVALAPEKLEPFLDESTYAGCQGAQVSSEDFPGAEDQGAFLVTLGITTEALAPVEGVPGFIGFREVRDIVRSNDSGETNLARNVTLHAFAGDTTIELSYSAGSSDVNANPIAPEVDAKAEAVLRDQAKKLAGA